ncbi:MAG: argininosuccinate lyase [Candidatus Kapabacteria bacterium]|nr:argininosuccinate lyase [Candidatus Kapabacteria bacterium]
MKLWEKGAAVDAMMSEFTVGADRAMDVRLARWDVVGSIAHADMLVSVGLLSALDGARLVATLSDLLAEIDSNGFVIDDGVEDVHSQVEQILVERLGDIGKRIHTGRSRNDQVLVDLKLWLRHELRTVRRAVVETAGLLLDLAERHRDVSLPGYTHYQVAMPSSFGLWLGGHAEALIEDLSVLDMAIHAANANPLGSAAGYGSTFPLDREATTRALNFDRVHVTSTFAQMSRGRTEKLAAMAIAQVASTLGRFASDVVLYMSQNFAFVTIPDAFTTGSSIMPHKKNPDVFEVMRARCNRLQALPTEIQLVLGNLPSGYHRDLQFVKDRVIPAIDEVALCLAVLQHVVPHVQPNPSIMQDARYRYIDSVDRVNGLVMQGIPFRDAYRMVADAIANNTYDELPAAPSGAAQAHLGSVDNPGIDELRTRLRRAL